MTSPRRRVRRAAALTTAMAVGVGLALTGTVAPAAAATPEPDLHYTMDDVAGSVVADSSGNGWDGTISGSTAVIDAEAGSALDLTGGNVTIPRPVLEGATDLTVSTRVRWDGGGSWQWMFGLGSGTDRYLFTSPSNGDGNLRTAVTRNGAGGEATITGAGAMPRDRYVDLTVTLDTDVDRITTYLDGAAVSSATTDASAGDLLTASAAQAGYIGRSFYPDPPFDGAIDDFQIFRSALTADEVAELTGSDAPALESIATTSIELRTVVGTAPALPATVRGSFTDGYARDVPVTWPVVDPAQYAQSGVFTVTGDAAGVEITAQVTVHRGEVRVDMAENTGDFLGGASGALYGLYGDDMPTANLVEGMKLKSIATKAQDGAQQPGSDALEVLPTMAAAGGDVLLRVTDWYRGFPYQWPGDTPAEKLADYRMQLDHQLDLIESVPEDQRAHLVIEPFNEPEGNMFGTGEWSLDGTSWLDEPDDYFAAWDDSYRRIKEVYPDMRVAGPGLSRLFPQMAGFLEHAVAADTVPDIITWHELSDPATIRTSVDRFRGYETAAFAGTAYEGRVSPININEYAFNYHTSVPGQMIQWISALEEKKVNGMIAYWNINGNIDDSVVQQNRANGQWWLYNAYGQMSGHTVELTPPSPGESYTLQGVSSLDESRRISRTLIGGASGAAPVDLVNVPADVFGSTVRVQVREIPWTGQIGDSPEPTVLSDRVAAVTDGALTLDFGSGDLPQLTESSAYEIVVTPGDGAEPTSATPAWHASYEAEDAEYTGSGYSRNGPEGTPQNVSNFYTSGNYDVGGLRTGSDGRLAFTVDVPEDGSYDLQVFANSLNTYAAIVENGPTNVFMTVDGAAEQELLLPLGYKWVVWDHSDTTVELTAGEHTIALAAESITGAGATTGDAIVDRIRLERSAAADAVTDYEAELADHTGALDADPDTVTLADGQRATFWVYGAADAEARLELLGSGTGTVELNGVDVLDLGESNQAAVAMQGGVNKVVVEGPAQIDKLRVATSAGLLTATEYQAEDGELAGSATVVDLSNAEGGAAVDAIGGAPGNDNTLTFTVGAAEAGPHAVVVRFSNPEQTPATHYNPNPMARHADISVNGGAEQSILFVPTFHQNNFWERTLVFDLQQGENTIRFSSEEQPNFDGVTYFEDNFPNLPLRADTAPIIDRITVSPLAQQLATPVTVTPTVTSDGGENGSGANEAGWYRDPVTVSFTADDADAAVEYRFGDTGEWSSAATPVTLTNDGTTTVAYRATRDGAPLEGSEGSVEVKLDRSAPISSAESDPESGTAPAGSTVTAVFSATDATSGVARTEYSIDAGATWTAATATGVSFTEVGTHTVQYRSVDVAGNVESPKSVTLTVAAPENVAAVSITSAGAANEDGWYAQPVLVAMTSPTADARVQYRVDGGTWRWYSSAVTVRANGTTVIDHRLLVSNVVVPGSEAQVQVKIDRAVPRILLERTPAGGTGTPRNPISMMLAASDALSGLASLEYRVNSGDWQPAPADAVIFDEVGDYVVSYRATDRVGNTTPIRSFTVVITPDVPTSVRATTRTVSPGGVVTLRLAGFQRYDDVVFTVGGYEIGRVLTDRNGAATISGRVPSAVSPGRSR